MVSDADRHEYRDVLHLARPAALQNHPIQVHVRELALDRTVAHSSRCAGRSERGTSATRIHAGFEASFKNPCRSASCSISLAMTADSVTCR